jgi:hypothetical protein
MNDLVQSHCTSLEAPDFQAIRQFDQGRGRNAPEGHPDLAGGG